MKDFNDKILQNLRRRVETVFGKRILISKDCTSLSLDIAKTTNRLISETTLKRIWELVNSPFSPSQYTLDTMAIYIGYQNWDEYFGNNHRNSEDGSLIMWEKIRSRATQISLQNINAIKKRADNNYDRILNRNFAETRIIKFINSSKTATAFIAPGGYGKTISTAKLVENLFLSDQAEFASDIVWFIDSSMLDMNITPEIDYENTQIELVTKISPYKSFINFFEKNPKDVRGKIFLIIDGLNEISTNYTNLEIIIDNIFKIIDINKDNQWFKIIITMRNNVWAIFQKKINIYNEQKDAWFDIDFEISNQETTNVPLLTNNEVSRILKINDITINFEHLILKSITSIEIFKIPYFLNIFINLFNLTDNISDVDLLTAYLFQKKVTENNNRINPLIFTLIERINLGINKRIIFKHEIEDILVNKETDMKILIMQGIIYETEINTKQLIRNSTFKFAHEILLDFLIAKYWTSKDEMNYLLLKKISTTYKENFGLRCSILIWIIKFAFKERNLEILENVYNFIEEDFVEFKLDILDRPTICNLVSSIGIEMRQYPDLQKQLLPIYAKNKNASYFYFEKFWDTDYINLFFCDTIEDYLKANNETEKQIFGYFVKFLKFYYQDNANELDKVFETMSSLYFAKVSHATFNLYLHCKILYQCATIGKANCMIVDYIKEIEMDYIKYDKKLIEDVDYNIIAIADAFNLANMHDNAISIATGIMKNYNIDYKAKKTRFYKYLQIIYANSMLHAGREKEAYEIFDKIDIYSDLLYSPNSKFFWLMRFILIKIDFLLYEKNYTEVLKKYEEVRNYAKMLKFTRIENICKKKMKIIKEKKNYN